MAAHPIVQSLIICDAIHLDPGSGKPTLLGIFSRIMAREFPTTHPQLAIFAELTNGHGQTPITLKIARVVADKLDGENVVEVQAQTDFQDPRSVTILPVMLGNVVFPEPGDYRVVIESGGSLLLERRLILERRER